jgi:hypothetical protein
MGGLFGPRVGYIIAGAKITADTVATAEGCHPETQRDACERIAPCEQQDMRYAQHGRQCAS